MPTTELLGQRILFLGAHADDIEIGCGGTAAKYAAAGRAIAFAQAADCGRNRRVEATNAAALLNLSVGDGTLFFGPIPDGRLEERKDVLANWLTDVAKRFRPDTIFVHRPDDTHPDHVALHQAVIRALVHPTLLVYPIPKLAVQSTPFDPNYWEDISAFLDTKLRLCACHVSQTGKGIYLDPDHLRSLARAAFQSGYGRTGGFAEPFRIQVARSATAEASPANASSKPRKVARPPGTQAPTAAEPIRAPRPSPRSKVSKTDDKAHPPEGPAFIVSVDLEGYSARETAWRESLPGRSTAGVRALRDWLTQSLEVCCRGADHELVWFQDQGDAWFFPVPTAEAAHRIAEGLHEAAAAETARSGLNPPLRFRIGIAESNVSYSRRPPAGFDAASGSTAARLREKSGPGGILISPRTWAALPGELPIWYDERPEIFADKHGHPFAGHRWRRGGGAGSTDQGPKPSTTATPSTPGGVTMNIHSVTGQVIGHQEIHGDQTNIFGASRRARPDNLPTRTSVRSRQKATASRPPKSSAPPAKTNLRIGQVNGPVIGNVEGDVHLGG